ncbi:MAG: SDR family oxidoreductase [Burkholderiales bacterium]
MTDAIVVLGAGGFIGRHVCRAMARLGHVVHGVGHGCWRGRGWCEWGMDSWTEGDITLSTLAAAAPTPPVAFIHCAGSGSVAFSYQNPLDDFFRSVDTTATLLDHIRTACDGRSRAVLTSSAAVYGEQGDVDLVESDVCAPMSPYGVHKLAAEGLGRSYSRFFDVPVSVVRLFSVYGEGLRKQLLWDAAHKFRRGDPRFFGTGSEVRDWIHVEDAADLLCAAALGDQEPFEVYNGGHAAASTRNVLTTLATHFPGQPQPVFTGETHTGNPRRLTGDSGHARRNLGWTPRIQLGDGLQRYHAWFAGLEF